MTIRNKIEKMNKIHHVKFFEILKNNDIPFSENRNGIFFNMNNFNDNIINQIDDYIQYIQKQEDNLKQTEKLKNVLEKEFLKIIKRNLRLIYIRMLHKLESYYITNDNIIQWTSSCIREREKINQTYKEKEIKTIKKQESYKHIRQKDGLFWAFFYICNGEFSYMTVHNTFSTEKLEKINYVQKIRGEKNFVKNIR